jgi:crossover junction endodeoxyribonuclease RusA
MLQNLLDGKSPGFEGDLAVTITFVQPDKRRRDRDNLLSACKPSLDGLAEAIGVDDSQFEPLTIRRRYGNKPGCVLVTVGA